LKSFWFTLEALNSFGTTFYIYYLFFFMQREFGFGNQGNLALAALNGFVYIFGAWFGGRFGQRHGSFRALAVGFSTMAAALLMGVFLHSVPGHILVLIVWTVGMCFTWPTLEALVSEGEGPYGLQRMIGIYNMIWAGMGGLAYFTGGLLLDLLGPRSLFFLPAGFHLLQLGLLAWFHRRLRFAAERAETPGADADSFAHKETKPVLNPRPINLAKSFLRMAWLANPFAYVAINTVVAVVPGIARELGLSSSLAGFFCSIWFFARLGAFWSLWLWQGWHYRFGWFVSAYILLVCSFACILLIPSLAVIVVAQIGFGIGLGVIYYSSLLYSMNVGEAKAEHGGLHEAAIGTGIFAGPAVGAATLYLFPNHPDSGALAVCFLLVCGLVGVLVIRWKHLQSNRPKSAPRFPGLP
jgi:MFS family permease